VGATTAERVRAIITELGYRPNLTARALAEGRAPTLALLVSTIANPFYPEFACAAEQTARREGHFLLVCHYPRGSRHRSRLSGPGFVGPVRGGAGDGRKFTIA